MLQMTKQNAYCNKRSVQEVIQAHPDFSNGLKPAYLKRQEIGRVELALYRKNNPEKGYAFVIEDSEEIRQQVSEYIPIHYVHFHMKAR